jgi:hypothetical protein
MRLPGICGARGLHACTACTGPGVLQGLCRMLADGDAQAGNAGWNWAAHAATVAFPPQDMWRWPSSGGHNDHAHPPIHPTQYAAPGTLHGPEKAIYEFVCRSFLACVSQRSHAERVVRGAPVLDPETACTQLQ